LGDHIAENALEALQIPDPSPDFGNVLFGDVLDPGARHAAATAKSKELADLVERVTMKTRRCVCSLA